MNADTGIAYDLGSDLVKDIPIGGMIPTERFEQVIGEGRSLTPDEMAAAVDSAKGDTLVRVQAEAAQRARLGDRELRRRKQRRR
jgi:hypothetical protein